jgi:hypothetical protein
MNGYNIDFLSIQPLPVHCGLEWGCTLSSFLFCLAFKYAFRMVLISEDELN